MRKNRFSFSLLITLIMGLLCVSGCAPEEEYIFPGVEGPDETTQELPFEVTRWEEYGAGSSSRLAILLSDESPNWLSLAHGLKTIGVPFLITKDYQKALQHHVIFVYPVISGRSLSAQALRGLKEFVSQGGVLITSEVTDSLNDLFGFKESVFTYDHYLLELNRENKANRNFNEKEEQLLYLKNPTTPVKEEGMLKTWNYSGFTGDILAAYEDGRPAIIQNHVGKGQAVAFGFDLGIFLANCYASNVEVWGNRYVNGFIPTADVFLRLIKELYLQGEPNAVIIGTVPDNKSLSVIFSHDVTSRSSMDHVVDYAKYEHGEGFSATYYIVTKYLSDYNDVYFFDADAVSLLNKISSMGMEVASHTVAHSLQFSAFPIGTGKEKYPTYRPIAMNIKITEGGSVMGELRVSKFLLEKLVDSTHVTSFRSGFLEEPRSLPQVLEATGYLFNTSTTANSTWSHLPFQLNYDYGRGGEVNIFQFPITIEDQMLPRMDKRIHEGIALAKKIASYGGICVILIHPEVVGYKLKFEKEFVKGVKEFSWFGSIEMFGKWWAARNAVSIDVTGTTGKKIVSLKIPKPLQGFSLMLPSQWTFEHAEPHNETISQQKETLFIGEAQEEMKLFFTMISSPGPV